MKYTNKTLKSLIGGGVTFLLIFALAGFTTAKTSEGDKSDVVLSQFGKVPAFFTENQGQTDNKVKYYFKGNDNVYFTDEGVMFQKIVREQGSNNHPLTHPQSPSPQPSPARGEGVSGEVSTQGGTSPNQQEKIEVKEFNAGSNPHILPLADVGGKGEGGSARSLAYKLEFIGARPTSPQARNELKGKVNYLIGNDRSKWHTNISTYQEIVYPNLYLAHSSLVQSSSIEPNVSVQATSLNQQGGGIDLVYKGVPGGMKYEFIVQPGADPDVIQLAYTGIEGLSIDNAGNLIIHTSLGDVKDAKPYCYQEIDGKQVEVKGNFVIMECSDHVAVNTHPQLLLLEGRTGLLPLFQEGRECLFPFYQEGIKGCVVNASMKNREKERFVYGFQVSSYNPNSPLIIDPGLEYSTFLGGGNYDEGLGIAVDGSGNAYVTGSTQSSDFPTTAGAYDETYNGSYDAFVTKLNTTGTALEYSTFLGGSSYDVGYGGIAVDGSGNAYVTGGTSSSNFPTTAGAFDESYSGFYGDVFVTKLNPTGTALEYSTFLGGSAGDGGYDIAVDGSGYVYVAGSTDSSDFPTTAGAFDTSHNGGYDAFVAKLSPSGGGASDLLYSTFLGGSSSDFGDGIAVNGSGYAYVAGRTSSANFPTTVGAYDETYNGGIYTFYFGDVFVSKLNPAGTGASDLLYSTFLGGSDDEAGYDIAVDGSGNAYVTGWTKSTGFPTTAGAYDETLDGTYDAFVAKLSPSGTGASDLLYSTFLGGSGHDEGGYGNGIAVDGSGNAYVTGLTNSTDFPTTAGAFDTGYNGGSNAWGWDAFVSKLSPSGAGVSDLLYSTFLGGSNDDGGLGIAVDGSGNAYVTGWTWSSDFPTTAGAFDTSYNGGDAFVTKLSTVTTIQVTIDIKPGSDPNSINLGSAGVIPVAILSSSTFDATTVNPTTVSLAGARVKLVGKSDKYLAHEEDVNGDSLLDLVCQVLTAEFMIEPGESVAVLEAETYDGTLIRGEDTVRIVQD